MDNLLIDTLAEQVNLGNKVDKSFKSSTYTAAAHAISTKLKTIKQNFAILKNLLNQSGFAWNDSTKTIDATPDVWATYIEELNKQDAISATATSATPNVEHVFDDIDEAENFEDPNLQARPVEARSFAEGRVLGKRKSYASIVSEQVQDIATHLGKVASAVERMFGLFSKEKVYVDVMSL
ncbi:PREDICTED: uncharacterized protein LOC109114155 [Nelumbo nucifera]|uniref:Uncharacterized protein LOC109114155 n=1 Tax=Nelumbo nucifera TaxID=4432 RepID=A0A1U8PZE0_NELNU|nr:PREDICTED: uncharacterized protein LOC109114155 [Nelumbo nucifera]